MTKKILYVVGVILALLVVIDTVSVFAPKTVEKLSASSNINSINFVPNATVGGDTYTMAFNGSTIMTINGQFVMDAAGYSGPFATSTTFTAAQLSVDLNQQWLGTTAVATATLPVATTTFLAYGSPALGALFPFKATNDSTNTINYVAGASTTFKCETQGVGTSTVIGGCSSTQVSIPAASTAYATMYWDTGSSTEVIEWGNSYH